MKTNTQYYSVTAGYNALMNTIGSLRDGKKGHKVTHWNNVAAKAILFTPAVVSGVVVAPFALLADLFIAVRNGAKKIFAKKHVSFYQSHKKAVLGTAVAVPAVVTAVVLRKNIFAIFHKAPVVPTPVAAPAVQK